jgi:uncharacterized protein DUF3943
MTCNAIWRSSVLISALMYIAPSTAHGVETTLPRATHPRERTELEVHDEPSGARRDRWLGPVRDRPAYGRAALEVLGVLAIGVAQYWANADTNSQDWDFPHWSDRLSGSGVRFDNNTHVTNNILHPLSGSAYYGLSRANGMGVAGSALYTAAASAAWEWTLEWREKISINDMVTTTVGGIAAGEFLIDLASYLNSAPGETNLGQDIAKVTLGFPIWAHDQLDRRLPDRSVAPDNLGFSSAYDHRFLATYQNAWLTGEAERTEQIQGIALDGRLVSLPGFMRPETFATAFAQGNISSGSLDLQFGGGSLREANVRFDAVLAGYYAQRTGPGVYGGLVGLATGLEFMTKDTLGQGDQYALVHCAGPEIGAAWRWGEGYQLDVRVRAAADFAAIRSLAFPAVRASDPTATYKSSLERRYQYNVGVSTRLMAELRLFAARLSAEYGWGTYRSIQGYDRFQEDITRDLAGSELLEDRRLGAALEPPGTPFRFYADLESLSHMSSLGGQGARRIERRVQLGAGFVF